MGAACLVSTSSAATRAAWRLALLLCLSFAPGLALQQVAPALESLAQEGSSVWHDNQLRLDEGSATRTIRLDKLQRLDGANGKCLNFLHIPKTAGTSIEEVSVQVVAASGGELPMTACAPRALHSSSAASGRRALLLRVRSDLHKVVNANDSDRGLGGELEGLELGDHWLKHPSANHTNNQTRQAL